VNVYRTSWRLRRAARRSAPNNGMIHAKTGRVAFDAGTASKIDFDGGECR
jgi:hypothetical protein